MKLIEWIEVQGAIATAFPHGAKMSTEGVELTHRMWMAKWPQRVILDAFELYVERGGKHPPGVGELIVLAKELASPDQNFDRAWLEALDNVRAYGYMKQPVWNDPVMERIMHVYGWQRFCQTEEDQLGYLRGHLKGAYESEKAHREVIARQIQRGEIWEITDGS